MNLSKLGWTAVALLMKITETLKRTFALAISCSRQPQQLVTATCLHGHQLSEFLE